MKSEEFTGRYHDGWVAKRFVLPLRNLKQGARLTVKGRRLPYPERLDLSFYVDGKLIHQVMNLGGEFTIQTELPPIMRGNLEIVASHIFIPKNERINEDVRELSFLLDEIHIPNLPNLIEPYLHLFDFKPSRKVYFLEEEVWDTITFLLDDRYKIPNRTMLDPLKQVWQRESSHAAASIVGTLYDKFSGLPLRRGSVQLLNEQKSSQMETKIDEHGSYRFDRVEPGIYTVSGSSEAYGVQEIKVEMTGIDKTIHLPMLPLV